MLLYKAFSHKTKHKKHHPISYGILINYEDSSCDSLSRQITDFIDASLVLNMDTVGSGCRYNQHLVTRTGALQKFPMHSYSLATALVQVSLGSPSCSTSWGHRKEGCCSLWATMQSYILPSKCFNCRYREFPPVKKFNSIPVETHI